MDLLRRCLVVGFSESWLGVLLEVEEVVLVRGFRRKVLRL